MAINRNFQIKNGISVGNGGTILVSSGNSIGIGTTNPTSTLQVVGTISATSFVGSGESLTNIPASSITNSSITVATSTGLTGGGTTSLGGTLTLSNTGVTSISSGSGITISATTGSVLISNSGMLSLTTSGNGISITGSNGAFTLSTGATSSNTASTLVYRDSSGNFSAGTITASLNGNASTATTSSKVSNSLTFDNSGTGTSSGISFDGSSAKTISYNTIGASPLAGSSSLTTTGTIISGTWSASFGVVSGANLTNLTAGNLTGTIPSSVLGNSTVYVGTTAISLNRASAAQTLSGINIDGNAGTATTSTNVIGSTNGVLYNSGTNTTTTSSNLSFDGTNLVVGGTVTANSDITLKENIITIPNALSKTLSLRGVEYDRIDNKEHQIGVIAQEVESVIPCLVKENSGIKSVAYQNLVGLLVEAIKEQQSQIDILKIEIQNLKG
jgi:Chaperone of endosialidase